MVWGLAGRGHGHVGKVGLLGSRPLGSPAVPRRKASLPFS